MGTTYPTTYRTTEAYISGAICGSLWWPVGQMAGAPFRANLRGQWGCMDRFTEPVSFRDTFDSLLNEKGGDYSGARFTADTRVVVIRKQYQKPGVYTVHVWERELSQLPDCADLVAEDVYTGDVIGNDD